MPTLTTSEALGTSFSYKEKTKLGRNLADQALEWFEKHGSETERTAATRLLSETTETISGGVVTREAKQKKQPDVVPYPVQPEDDGFPPVGVTPPAPAAPMQVMPKWAKDLKRSMDKLIHDVSRFEVLFDVAERMAKEPKTATGVGHGAANGGGVLHIVKIKVTPKGDGKVGIDFFDDNPEHKYPEIRETRKATRWASTLPQGVDISDEQIYKVDWDVAYKLSDNKTEKGNPYKDVVTVTPRK